MRDADGVLCVVCCFVLDVREIGDMDEGIVEGGEDACDAEDELACEIQMLVFG